MNTAEKRALLEAAGEPWPDCDCHGQPMYWTAKKDLIAGGSFRCRIRFTALQRERRDRRRQSGRCYDCGGPLETATRCAHCADMHRDNNWRHDQKLPRQLSKYLNNIRYRNKQRADEGFRPTGVGLAAYAAWTKGGK